MRTIDAKPLRPSASERSLLRRVWREECVCAQTARAAGDAPSEWHHLERAHVLSQPMAAAHMRTHLAMLMTGVRARDRREVLGQIIRLAVAGPGTWSRRYPVGNTGGAAISAFAVLPIPADLCAYFRATP